MTQQRNEHPRTVDQAAEELSLKPSTMRAWIAQRRIGHVRLGRAVRIPAAEIQRLLEAGYVPAERSR
ncbi:MAG: helix-turn-helix domain-containing protein [Acidobacteria bacterium]|nr:helix-turn-helix domain-containing protein [Acidobacteriota bacterium]